MEKKKHRRKIITLETITENYVEKLRKNPSLQGFGKTVLLFKLPNQPIQKEVFTEDRWKAVEKAIRLKNANPNAIVKLIV